MYTILEAMPLSVCLMLASLLSSLLFGSQFCKMLSRYAGGQTVRECLLGTHAHKVGTPNMGGFIMFAPLLLCFATYISTQYWLLPVTFIGCMALGFTDDFRKFTKKNVMGVSPAGKLIVQFGLAFVVTGFLFYVDPSLSQIIVPFYGTIDVGFVVYWLLSTLAIVATSNSVNLTDGLDGLATVPIMLCTIGLLFTANLAHMHGLITPERLTYLTVINMSFVGGCAGFLWFNLRPARIFMGDVGSLTSGFFIGVCAVLTKAQLLLPLFGLLFVIESSSVILQLASLKLRKRRIFLIAPIHHHFERKGYTESQVVFAFWAVALLGVAAGLMVAWWSI